MEARRPKPHLIRTIILLSLVLSGAVSISGCWDDFVWPPGRGGSDPTVDAGADRSVHEGDSITLTANASDDGDITRYTWEQTGGRPLNFAAWEGLPLADGDSASLSLDIPWLREGREGPVELTVTVTDDEGNTARDKVVLTIEQRRFVVFKGVDSSRQGADGEPFRALYRANLDGGTPSILHPYLGHEEITGFRISPTGQYVAFNVRQNDNFNLYVAPTYGGTPALIDQGGYLDPGWQWSPVDGRLAYLAAHTCDCGTQMELYIATPAGNRDKVTGELSRARTVDALQWAPDGMAIAWSVLNPDTNGRELFVSPAGDGGTSPTSVSAGLAPPRAGGGSFQWSPYCGEIELSPFGNDRCDANMIAYIADSDVAGRYELFVSPVDGYPSWRVSGNLIAEGDVSAFQWAAGGVRIAYLANRRYVGVPELFVTDNSGGIDHLITRPGSGSTRGGRVEGFRWGPDGTRIGFMISQGMAPGTPVELRTALWDGSDNNSVTVDLPSWGSVREFAWSPAGSHIAYTADISSPGTRDLFVATADGSSKSLVSGFTESDKSSVSRFGWSPDGSRVALLVDSRLPTYNELFTATPDGSVSQISSPDLPMPPDQGEVADDFDWSPDGAHIVYRTRYGSQPGINELLISTPAGGGSQTLAGEPITPHSFAIR